MKEPADGGFRSHPWKEREIPQDVQFMYRSVEGRDTDVTCCLVLNGTVHISTLRAADLRMDDRMEMIWKEEVLYGQTDVLQRHFSGATD